MTEYVAGVDAGSTQDGSEPERKPYHVREVVIRPPKRLVRPPLDEGMRELVRTSKRYEYEQSVACEAKIAGNRGALASAVRRGDGVTVRRLQAENRRVLGLGW